MSQRLTLGIAAALAIFASPFAAQAQDYPSRPVKIVVPFGAGGPITQREPLGRIPGVTGEDEGGQGHGGHGGIVHEARRAAPWSKHFGPLSPQNPLRPRAPFTTSLRESDQKIESPPETAIHYRSFAGVVKWQTRMVQVHVLARAWRFKSSLRHHKSPTYRPQAPCALAACFCLIPPRTIAPRHYQQTINYWGSFLLRLLL